MRFSAKSVLPVLATALVVVGCAGPEQKLGRGLTNLTEFTRLGEMSYSIEQTSLFDDPTAAGTTGFIRGFNRSLARTAAGVWEVVTFPLPNYKNSDYGPIYKSEYPKFPDSYTPGMFADSFMTTDSSLGFGSGEIAPMVPGSRFRIFEP